MQLPDFPWDRLTPAKQRAAAHPDGIVDLSVGTPVDATPRIVQDALAAATDAPGYPTTQGTVELRQAAVGWLQRSLGVVVEPENILPLIGTKEFVAWLPTLLGLGATDTVASPPIAYPTYEVGALMAGSRTTVAGEPAELTWINSPSNPTGAVMSATELQAAATKARARGKILVSDECYIELAWDADPVSLLHPQVCGGDHSGLLAIHSLSKRSNMAGYRFGFAVGDPALIDRLLQVRKHAGMMVPLPVQAAARAALDDDSHVVTQREVYRSRRAVLRAALESAGFRIDDSQAGLYLWATRGQPCWETVNALAASGILVAPGDFYGTAGAQHVRVALTATDERVRAAADRLGALQSAR